MKEKLYQTINVTIKSVDEEKSTLEAIFSTADEDRHGDIVRQNWDLKMFKKNPVILNSHNYWSATDVIGKAIKIAVSDGKLSGKIKFAVEENPIAKIIFDLYKGGFLNAFSVGFLPKEFSDKGEILKSELLEISAVSVPANAYALAKSAGINIKPLFKGITDVLTDDEIEDEEDIENEEKVVVEEAKELEKEETEDEIKEEEEEVVEKEIEEPKEEEKIEDEVKDEIENENENEDEVEDGACSIGEDCEKQLLENTNSMLKLVRASGEILKVETLQEGVRAEARRLLNKTIRESVRIVKNK